MKNLASQKIVNSFIELLLANEDLTAKNELKNIINKNSLIGSRNFYYLHVSAWSLIFITLFILAIVISIIIGNMGAISLSNGIYWWLISFPLSIACIDSLRICILHYAYRKRDPESLTPKLLRPTDWDILFSFILAVLIGLGNYLG